MQQIIGGTAVWQGIPGALKYGPKMFARAPTTTTFVEQMSPSEAARYRAYWEGVPRRPGVELAPRVTPGVIPKDSYPKPPKWSDEWTWEPASGEEYAPQWRWWDTEGGEWRYHFPDKHHSVGHWDYNPWDHPCSQWQTVPDPIRIVPSP